MIAAWMHSLIVAASLFLCLSNQQPEQFPNDLKFCCVKIEAHHFDDADTGSGTIVAKENGRYLIITCAHVVDPEKQCAVLIKLNDQRVYCADVVGVDLTKDLAAVSVKALFDARPIGIRKNKEMPKDTSWQAGHPMGEGLTERSGRVLGIGKVSSPGHPRFNQKVYVYSFDCISGDSGSGVFAIPTGELTGVVWGGSHQSGTSSVTGIEDIANFITKTCGKEFPKFTASLLTKDKQP